MSFLTLAIEKQSGQPTYINHEGYMAKSAVPGIPIMVDRKDPFKLVPTNTTHGVEISHLPESCFLSGPKIAMMCTGSVEAYR